MNTVAVQLSFDYGGLDTETRSAVQQWTTEIKDIARRTATDIVDIGQRLAMVKSRLGHGYFVDWLESEFSWSVPTAERFMRVAVSFQNRQIDDLSPSVLYMLSAPSVPDEARQEAVGYAQLGEHITVARAREIINDAKPEGADGKRRPTHYAPREEPEPYTETRPQQAWTPEEFDEWFDNARMCTDCTHYRDIDIDDMGFCKLRDETIGAVGSLLGDVFTRAEKCEGYQEEGADDTPATHQLISQSLSNEWYTPCGYTDAARAVMGGIDLDPASNDVAQSWIGATRYHTAQDDGLSQEWSGRVWLNPPWGRLTGDFISKLASEMAAGRVTEAIVLVNAHATDTQWFTPLWDGDLCFTNHRINYTAPNGTESAGSTHGSVFVYFGPNSAAFAKAFGRWGTLVRRITVDDQ